MDQLQLKKLIANYLNGTASPAEEAELERWYMSFDKRQALTEFLDKEQKQQLESRLLYSVNKTIDEQLYGTDAGKGQIRRFNNPKAWFIAASVALIIGFFWLKYPAHHAPVQKAAWTAIAAGKSEIKKIRLPDGSSVWLNADSRIRFKNNFRDQKREIWLEGEAYFDVVHDTSRAFEVHAGVLTTHVLGTAFNIDAYGKNQPVRVTVSRGKVAVGNQTKHLAFLERNGQLIYEPVSDKFSVSNAEAADITAWTKGEMIFKEESLGEIAARLERWYNAEISFAAADLKSCRLTASFDTHVSLENVLKMLCKVSGNKSVQATPKGYLISGKPCRE